MSAGSARAVLLLGVFACTPLACGSPSERELSGVVLIVIDTLRSDRLSAYGNERSTSPVFDRLARRGVLFEQAISPSSWTLPSMIGLLTGRFPSEESFQDERLVGSLVEVLQRAGVRTAGFTEGGFASARFGFSRGFESYQERPGKVALAQDSEADRDPAGSITSTFADAEQFLRELRDERFFLWVHTYEPHTPYLRGIYLDDLDPGAFGESFIATLRRAQRGEFELTETERSYVEALYDGGVRVSDAHVARLLRALRDSGRARSTAIIVTSDHGEDLGGRASVHVASHGHSLYDDLIRVPLVVHDPRGRYPPGRITTQVSTLDIAPTILELLGEEPPDGLDGRSLMPVMLGHETAHRVAFSRVHRKGPPTVSVRDGRYKLIRDLSQRAEGVTEIYDLAVDPGETRDLAGSSPEIEPTLEQELERFRAELQRRGALDFSLEQAALPDELRDQLRVLGYLDEEGEAADVGPAARDTIPD